MHPPPKSTVAERAAPRREPIPRRRTTAQAVSVMATPLETPLEWKKPHAALLLFGFPTCAQPWPARLGPPPDRSPIDAPQDRRPRPARARGHSRRFAPTCERIV